MAKDPSSLNINEVTSVSDAVKEFASIGYSISTHTSATDTPWQHSNSAHLAVRFHPGSTFLDARAGLERLLNILATRVDIYRGRLFVVGVILEEGPGHMHSHLCVKSPKSRKSGRTIARIREHLPAVQGGVSDSSVRSFALEPIHDLPGLFAYITGPKNLSNPSTTKSWIFQ
ncbi:MAG: hypothetical protein RBR35_09385 [Salinivirgaceae bacterium]|nr:hypothetical protein [Salinivirgaceae bacterium]